MPRHEPAVRHPVKLYILYVLVSPDFTWRHGCLICMQRVYTRVRKVQTPIYHVLHIHIPNPNLSVALLLCMYIAA